MHIILPPNQLRCRVKQKNRFFVDKNIITQPSQYSDMDSDYYEEFYIYSLNDKIRDIFKDKCIQIYYKNYYVNYYFIDNGDTYDEVFDIGGEDISMSNSLQIDIDFLYENGHITKKQYCFLKITK